MEKPAPAEKPAKAKSAADAGGNYAVQLGAFSAGKSAAEHGWTKLVAAHPSLKGLKHRVVAGKGPHGQLFRLQAIQLSKAHAESLCAGLKAKTLFATHYHELTDLAREKVRVKNCSIAVREQEGRVIFLRTLVAGAASRSYGIQVARLAGLPDAVVQRARDVLHQLETGETSGKAARLVDDLPLFSVAAKREAAKPDALINALTDLNPDDLTPREALEALYRLKTLSR